MLPGDLAVVEFGGSTEEVSVALVESAPGDIVLVHAGVAIHRLIKQVIWNGGELT